MADANRHGRAGKNLYLRSRQQRQTAPLIGGDGATLADANSGDGYGRGGFLQMGRGSGSEETQDDAAFRRIEWPAEPDIPRVAHGVSDRVAKLRAFGNAIVPQVAAEFVKAALEAMP